MTIQGNLFHILFSVWIIVCWENCNFRYLFCCSFISVYSKTTIVRVVAWLMPPYVLGSDYCSTLSCAGVTPYTSTQVEEPFPPVTGWDRTDYIFKSDTISLWEFGKCSNKRRTVWKYTPVKVWIRQHTRQSK